MIIECKNLSKSFIQGDEQINIVKDLNFSIQNNDFVSIVGESGSGKTTFLNLMSGLERPSSGSIFFDGEDINNFNEYELSNFRADKIGFISTPSSSSSSSSSSFALIPTCCVTNTMSGMARAT